MLTSLPLVSSEKHAAQRPEKLRKKLSLNYKSAALPAELCRRPPYESCFQRVDQEFVMSYFARRAACKAIIGENVVTAYMDI